MMRSQGMDPQEMMRKLMADPEMMQLMMKPKVMQALQDLQTDPNSVAKHMSDPDVSAMFNKLLALQLGSSGAGQSAEGAGEKAS